MDWTYSSGVSTILHLQNVFMDQGELMLTFSHLGDPRNAFLLYFPVAYFIDKTLGIKTLWMAVISEWLNAVFKWILYGERPYWWVNEHVLPGLDTAKMQQYRLTCETGPGSPSGHAMVTAAVLWTGVIYCKNCDIVYKKWLNLLSHLLFFLLLSLVCISRCFIATHFPHQVVAGTAAGMLLASLFYNFSIDKVQLTGYIASSLLIILSVLGLYHGILRAGFDPSWSMTLAIKWCARKEWIHLDTNLFFAVMRDAGACLGLGIALAVVKTSTEPSQKGQVDLTWSRGVACIAAVGISLGQEYIPLPHSSELLFYSLAFSKHVLLSILVVWLFSFLGGDKSKAIKNS